MTAPEGPRQPTVEPTRPGWVALAVVLGGGACALLMTALVRFGSSLPRVEPVAWLSVGLLAGGVGYLAVVTRRLVRDRRADLDAKSALYRLLLGKTSILAGAGLGAAYVVLVAFSLPGWPAPFAQGRVVHGGVAAVLCAVWAVAGWRLERACRIPDDPDDGESDDEASGDTRPDHEEGGGPALG